MRRNNNYFLQIRDILIIVLTHFLILGEFDPYTYIHNSVSVVYVCILKG